jgi:small subunit ribosomal protein S3
MGQKVNPIGFRLSVRRDWKSRWYAKGRAFSQMVIKDAETRRYIEKNYAQASVSRIEIERTQQNNVRLVIYCGRPGALIGKKGEGIDRLRAVIRKRLGLADVSVDIKEINQPEGDAKLIALNIASQLENRIMFRRAVRRAIGNAQRIKEVEGVKIMTAGRLNGIEIARTEWNREGRVPLHTLKNDIDYGFAEANTDMGVIGIKVWLSKGESETARKKAAKYSYEEAQHAADAKAASEEAEKATQAAQAEGEAEAQDAPPPAAEQAAEQAPEAGEEPKEQGDDAATV